MRNRFFRTLIMFMIIITIPFPAYADYGPIQIDSYYDDWEDKPHTEVYPGNNPEKKANQVSLFRDESNVYVHVIFADSNNQGIKNMTIDLRTNLGDAEYDIVADSFEEDEEENFDVVPDENFDVAPEEETDSNAEPEEGADLEVTPQDEGSGSDSLLDPESGVQNLFSNRLQENYFMIADNEVTAEEPEEVVIEPEEVVIEPEEVIVEPEEVIVETEEVVIEPTDQPSEEGQGTELEPTDQKPAAEEYNVEPDDILDQLAPDVMDQEEEEQNGNMNLKKPGAYGTWAFSVWNEFGPVGSGYYTKSEGEPDELELYIPLSSVTQEYDGITEISMIIKKLGKQEIFSVGASTGPFIGIAAGMGIAALSAGAYTYRKKRPSWLVKGR